MLSEDEIRRRLNMLIKEESSTELNRLFLLTANMVFKAILEEDDTEEAHEARVVMEDVSEAYAEGLDRNERYANI